MPTFTGVCSWQDLPSVLTDLVNSTGYFSPVSKIDLSGGTGGTAGQTVYTAPNGVVVTSSAPVMGGPPNYYMSYLFDGTITPAQTWTTTYWLTSSSGNQTLTFDFGALGSVRIAAIVVYPRTRDDASSNYRILVSDNGTTYTEIVPWVINTHDANTPYGTRRVHFVDISSRFVRFELTRNGSHGVTLSEIEFLTGVPGSLPLFVFSYSGIAYSRNAALYSSTADVLPYVPLSSFEDKKHYLVQYLLKVESDYAILAVQGIYQVDASARTHLAYVGKLGTPPGAPPAYGAASTIGTANLTATLSDSRRANVVTSYSVHPPSAPQSPDIDGRFLLAPIYVYRADEGWRGWFNDLYVAQVPQGALLSGETVTAQDGSKYTFFNIPASGDGYYNNFLASGDTGKWLVVKH